MQKIELTLKQLFQALPEKYNYLTCDKEICYDHKNVQRYIHAWEFEPYLDKGLGDLDEWQGAIKTNEELGYEYDLYEEDNETSYILNTNLIWEVVEFKNKDTKDCIAKRQDYI